MPVSWTESAPRNCGPWSTRRSRNSVQVLSIAVTPDLVDRFNAAHLIKRAVEAMGGSGGGGKPDFAQGGAPDGARADAGIAAVKAALQG